MWRWVTFKVARGFPFLSASFAINTEIESDNVICYPLIETCTNRATAVSHDDKTLAVTSRSVPATRVFKHTAWVT
jgi:hypothetical protein